MKVNANTMRAGHIIEKDDKLWRVLKHEIITPGKGAAVIQVELRDIVNGNKDNVRFRTQETVEKVRLDQKKYQYLFNDGESYTFMDQETYEQVALTPDIIGEDFVVFLQDGMVVEIEFHEETPLGVQLPDSVILEVVEAEPVIKGQTATSSYKPAIMDNGIRVMVPPHIDVGTKIEVKTEDSTYMGKVS